MPKGNLVIMIGYRDLNEVAIYADMKEEVFKGDFMLYRAFQRWGDLMQKEPDDPRWWSRDDKD